MADHRRQPTYSADKRGRCMGRLYASAAEVDGEPLPNFHAVSKQEDVHPTTLRHWWDDRDKEKDKEWLQKASQSSAKAFVDGAQDWGERFASQLKQRATELVEDSDRWKEAKVDEVARAIRAFNLYQRELAAHAGADTSKEAVALRVKEAITRKRMSAAKVASRAAEKASRAQ